MEQVSILPSLAALALPSQAGYDILGYTVDVRSKYPQYIQRIQLCIPLILL